MNKEFVRGRRPDVSGQRIQLFERENNWYRVMNDGREQKLSAQQTYRLIFEMGFMVCAKRTVPAVFGYDRAKFLLSQGFVLIDRRLNRYQLVNGKVKQNGRKIVSLPINTTYIIDLFREKSEVSTQPVEKEKTYAQGRLRKARPRYKPTMTRVCIGDEHTELQELKADLEEQEWGKASIPQSEDKESFFWDLLPVAAGSLVGLGVLWWLVDSIDNKH